MSFGAAVIMTINVCPPFQAFYHPILAIAAEVGTEIGYTDAAQRAANRLGLSATARQELTKGKRYERYWDRTYWACTYLVKAGLLDKPRPGYVVINAAGRRFLESHPHSITRDDLLTIPAFAEYQGQRARRR